MGIVLLVVITAPVLIPAVFLFLHFGLEHLYEQQQERERERE